MLICVLNINMYILHIYVYIYIYIIYIYICNQLQHTSLTFILKSTYNHLLIRPTIIIKINHIKIIYDSFMQIVRFAFDCKNQQSLHLVFRVQLEFDDWNSILHLLATVGSILHLNSRGLVEFVG